VEHLLADWTEAWDEKKRVKKRGKKGQRKGRLGGKLEKVWESWPSRGKVRGVWSRGKKRKKEQGGNKGKKGGKSKMVLAVGREWTGGTDVLIKRRSGGSAGSPD